MRTLAPHTLILAAILSLGACAPAADAPTPKSEAAAEIVKSEPATKSAQSENERLDAWFEANYKATIRAYPQTLTSRGIDERQDEWNDPSRSFRLEQLEKSREALAEMRANFDFNALDEIINYLSAYLRKTWKIVCLGANFGITIIPIRKCEARILHCQHFC